MTRKRSNRVLRSLGAIHNIKLVPTSCDECSLMFKSPKKRTKPTWRIIFNFCNIQHTCCKYKVRGISAFFSYRTRQNEKKIEGRDMTLIMSLFLVVVYNEINVLTKNKGNIQYSLGWGATKIRQNKIMICPRTT